MDSKRIVFIGGGNMAAALLAGLAAPKGVSDGFSSESGTSKNSVPGETNSQKPLQPRYELRVADPGDAQREYLGTLPGVTAYVDNQEAVDGADCVIFAVKPQIMRQVCTDLTQVIEMQKPLLVSVAAGIGCDPISRWFNGHRRIVRAMPNTPALVGAGATGLYAAEDATADDIDLVDAIFSAVGLTAWVDDEALIDVVIAISGSGPAYFFYLLEAMEDAGCAQGLSREMAQRLARQTALGAARMALNEAGTLEEVRRRVTSPGGTTAAALEVLAEHKLPTIMDAAIKAASSRAKTLAIEFGTDSTL